MNDAIYQQAITELAKSDSGSGRLARADRRATLDNPLCGDRVTIELAIKGDRITALAHEVRGCVLCRASAAVLGRRAPGQRRDEIAAVHQALRAMLRGEKAGVAGWREFDVFQPVGPHKSRHECVLLPVEAVVKALGPAGAG
ncbi:MAG: iron-sulfur cluster assembly scaffold protein, partial [Alphaproteobacteria bacterium]|nr:iron-sulfur cluster assembly scaffold protein [Alphaproteobacteria bacterium]